MSDFDFHPKMAAVSHVGGYHVPGNMYKIGKACDAWLARRYALEGRRPAISQWRKATEYRAPEPHLDAAREAARLAKAVAAHKPKGKAVKITVPRDPKPNKSVKPPRKHKPRVKKYATPEERRAAMAANTAAYWAEMDPAKRAERLEAMRQRKIKHPADVPRHKRPEWLAYKREWERQRRKTHPLTEAQLEHRRAQARKNDRARRAKRKAEAAKLAAAAAATTPKRKAA